MLFGEFPLPSAGGYNPYPAQSSRPHHEYIRQGNFYR